MDEILTELCNITDSLSGRGNTYHGLGGMNCNRCNPQILLQEMLEQLLHVHRLSMEEIFNIVEFIGGFLFSHALSLYSNITQKRAQSNIVLQANCEPHCLLTVDRGLVDCGLNLHLCMCFNSCLLYSGIFLPRFFASVVFRSVGMD
jgi:hypothetical protein